MCNFAPRMSADNDFVKITAIENTPEYDRKNIHQHDYYELVWFTDVDGEDTIQIDFGDYPVEPDCFYFISARQLHRIDRTGKRGIVIALSPEFFNNIVEVNVYPRSTFAINSIINQRKCDLCRSMVHLITTEYDRGCRYSLMEAYFKALFIHMGPILSKNPTVGSKRKAADLLDLIEENYIEHRDVSFYSEQMAMSDKAINDVSKKVLGKTVKDIIQDRLVLEIKREIASGSDSFKEIAFHLKFNEPSYFTRFFKQKTGYSPEKYREHFYAMLEE